MNAYTDEIDESIHRWGFSFASVLVNAILEDTDDKNVYILLSDGKNTTGNLGTLLAESRIVLPRTFNRWIELPLNNENSDNPDSLLLRRVIYPNHVSLTIAYDMVRVHDIQSAIFRAIASNIVLSFLLAFGISVIIVWLINLQLAKINDTCRAVINGDLGQRVKVIKSNDQFDILANNINQMLDWINILLDTLRESSNALAHDIRTPLSRHRLSLQALLSSKELPVLAQEKLVETTAQVDALVSMFDQILTIARAESRSSSLIFESFDIIGCVLTTVDFYETWAEERGISIRTAVPVQSQMFHGDKQLIAQALLNLIDNAVKYAPDKSIIRVGLELGMAQDARQSVSIIISDSGPGIPESLRERVTERFYRIDPSRETKGTGLGLSLVKAVADLHHGFLEFDDNNPGLIVRLTLTQPIIHEVNIHDSYESKIS